MAFFMTPSAAGVLLAAGTTFSPALAPATLLDPWRVARLSSPTVRLFSPRGVVPTGSIRDPLTGWLPRRTEFAVRPGAFPVTGFRPAAPIAPGINRLAEESGRPRAVAPGFRTNPFTGRSAFVPGFGFNPFLGRPLMFNNAFTPGMMMRGGRRR